MKILWLTWKDREHPLAGGAEVVNEELAKRLVKDGHEVTFVVGGFSDSKSEERRDGFTIVRVGGRYSVYWHAYRLYKKRFSLWPDLVIDEMNTIPFFAKLYVKQRNLMFVHQLCRQIWFYQTFFPINLIGYLLEPLYLRLLNDREVITISESTKQDLLRYGFSQSNVHIITEGIDISPISSIEFEQRISEGVDVAPIILSIGRIEPMKRTLDVVRAFESLKKDIPKAQLVIAGFLRGAYGEKIQKASAKSLYSKDITITGIVTKERKIELLREASVLVLTSIKEGWGLVVTEAASQGRPSVVYNIDGLRDAVKDGETGIVTKANTPQEMGNSIISILQTRQVYERLCRNAWEWSKGVTFDNAYREFTNILTHV